MIIEIRQKISLFYNFSKIMPKLKKVQRRSSIAMSSSELI